jgi:hypothetical protein
MRSLTLRNPLQVHGQSVNLIIVSGLFHSPETTQILDATHSDLRLRNFEAKFPYPSTPYAFPVSG